MENRKTAMQELFDNLESIDVKVPIGVKQIFLDKEKEQIATKDYLQGFIDLHNNELEHWEAVEFLEWLKLNDFKIVKK